MICPSADRGFCPSKDQMEEHTTEWWTEYYCQTCGCEHKVKFDAARRKKLQKLPPPSPVPKKKKTRDQ